jgi:hypothetical protein
MSIYALWFFLYLDCTLSYHRFLWLLVCCLKIISFKTWSVIRIKIIELLSFCTIRIPMLWSCYSRNNCWHRISNIRIWLRLCYISWCINFWFISRSIILRFWLVLISNIYFLIICSRSHCVINFSFTITSRIRGRFVKHLFKLVSFFTRLW